MLLGASFSTIIGFQYVDLMDSSEKLLDLHLSEYSELKSEQSSRIGFRDNLLYVTLVSYGGVISFAVSSSSYNYAFLVLPWISLILGWTYLVNDQKISAIGRYIRDELTSKIQHKLEDQLSFWEWERYHRKDKRRTRRKVQQLIIDLITFIISGILSLAVSYPWLAEAHNLIKMTAVVELILVLILGIEMVLYADLTSGYGKGAKKSKKIK